MCTAHTVCISTRALVCASGSIDFTQIDSVYVYRNEMFNNIVVLYSFRTVLLSRSTPITFSTPSNGHCISSVPPTSTIQPNRSLKSSTTLLWTFRSFNSTSCFLIFFMWNYNISTVFYDLFLLIHVQLRFSEQSRRRA